MAAVGDAGEGERLSVLLSRLLDRKVTGTRESVNIKRRIWPIQECIENSSNSFEDLTYCGSQPEGIVMEGSDLDILRTDKNVVVLYQGQSIPSNYVHKTVLYMREAGCRPGYATLQLGHFGETVTEKLSNSLVSVRDVLYVSSDIYRERSVKNISETTGMKAESHGPSSILSEMPFSTDHVYSFASYTFPRGANEWIHRTRMHGWPPQALVDKIVHTGCHLVPIGDTCSEDTLLQWRISLVTAERRLVHSLTHIQFQVYSLLKYFLKQIHDSLEKTIGDRDILCSYFMKTVIFFAVESTHQTFWQEKNLFYCFWYCFNILMTWVKSGYCPNYFVISNNMFKKKVYGQNQRKLLRILDQCHQLKWMCLSVGTCFNPSIMEYLSYSGVQAELDRPQTQQKLEHDNDMEILDGLKWCRRLFLYRNTIISPVALLLKSQSEVDELITYYSTVCTLSTLATGVYPDCSVPIGNKARYKSMTKCKHWLIPGSLFGTEVLYLATFHFKTGNYRKAIQICNGVMLLKTFGIDDETRVPPERQASHVHAYCGQGYSSIDKLKKIFTYHLFFKDNPFCLSQFQPELSKCSRGLYIPSLPYAVFLCFLCCHELGDIRGREAVLRRLIMVKYDELQGGHKHWIVHTLLGICYETLGDNHRAITAYLESYQTKTLFHELNPAMERIEALRSNSG